MIHKKEVVKILTGKINTIQQALEHFLFIALKIQVEGKTMFSKLYAIP